MAERATNKKPTYRLRKGDEVIVTVGKCVGQTGKIDRIDSKTGRVYVGNLNLSKRHTRPNMSNQQGGIIEKAMPLDISNVMLLDPKTKKPTRIGYKTESGKKVRYAKASGSIL